MLETNVESLCDPMRVCLEVFREPEVAKLMTPLFSYHRSSYEHSVCVASRIAQAFYPFLSYDKLKLAVRAAFLHDIGKEDIPKQILDKPAPLSNIESLEIQQHPRRGFDMIREAGLEEAAKIIIGHHEIGNGNGHYPRKHARIEPSDEGRYIHLITTMLAIADQFDAARQNRAYKGVEEREMIAQGLRAIIPLKHHFLIKAVYGSSLTSPINGSPDPAIRYMLSGPSVN